VAEEQPDPGLRRWLRQVGVLTAVLVLVLAGVLMLAVRKHSDNGTEAGRAAAVVAAEHFVLMLTDLSSEGDQSKLDALLPLSTGNFRRLSGSLAPAWHEAFKIGNVRSQGSIVAIGVQRYDANSVDILASVQSQISDIKVPAGELRKYRMGITMQRVGDQWLASDVGIVP
jgi:Mce-associated membrane protein